MNTKYQYMKRVFSLSMLKAISKTKEEQVEFSSTCHSRPARTATVYWSKTQIDWKDLQWNGNKIIWLSPIPSVQALTVFTCELWQCGKLILVWKGWKIDFYGVQYLTFSPVPSTSEPEKIWGFFCGFFELETSRRDKNNLAHQPSVLEERKSVWNAI